MPAPRSPLVAFAWKVGTGVSSGLDRYTNSRWAVSLTAPVGVFVAGLGAVQLSSPFHAGVGLLSLALWGSIWRRPFKGVPFQQVLPRFLSSQKKILRACRRGDLDALRRLSHPDFNFSFVAPYASPSHPGPGGVSLTPLSLAIAHCHWDVVDYLLPHAGQLFGSLLPPPPAFSASTSQDPSAGVTKDQFLALSPVVFINLAATLPPSPSSRGEASLVFSLWDQYLATAPASSLAATLHLIMAGYPPNFSPLIVAGALIKRAAFRPDDHDLLPLYHRLALDPDATTDLLAAIDTYGMDVTYREIPAVSHAVGVVRSSLYKSALVDGLAALPPVASPNPGISTPARL